MDVDESTVTEHYRQPDLIASICSALEKDGVSLSAVKVQDLAPVDEFHVGGRPATERLCSLLEVAAGEQVLDLGCGIGGLARYLAHVHGATVTGIDLTPDYVATATALTDMVRLGEHASFRTGSITSLPFEDDSFDVATQLHVGMNIADKASLFGEVARVLRSGGRLGVYDVMLASQAASGEPAFDFPVPWASDASMSHVASADTYVDALRSAGFEITAVIDRGESARESFAARRTAPTAPMARGLHLLMGPDIGTKVANLATAITTGALAPTEIIATAKSAR